MDQANEFETAVNTLPTFAQVDGSDFAQDVDAASILRNAAATPPLARRVKVSFGVSVFGGEAFLAGGGNIGSNIR